LGLDLPLLLCRPRRERQQPPAVGGFYLDLNEDGKLSSTEYVVGVSWQGSNRATETALYPYIPRPAQAIRWVMPPGSPTAGTCPARSRAGSRSKSGFGGAANGVEMEDRIAWSRLGVPSGTPVKFHVSASNSTNLPSGILDNMAGPGEKIGWMRSFGVRLDPDRSTTSTSPGRVVFAQHRVQSRILRDTINFRLDQAAAAFAPASIALYRDANADGLLDAGDPALIDTDGDARVDTGALPVSGTTGVLVDEQVPAGQPEGERRRSRSTASSSKGPAFTDTGDRHRHDRNTRAHAPQVGRQGRGPSG
jgi:hypothetical protein